MFTEAERGFFEEHGYVHVPGVLDPDHLDRVRDAFDKVWAQSGPPVNRDKLLTDETFIELIEHPPIVDRHRALFGNQTQLLQYDLLQQGPRSNSPARLWHRDFVFPGDRVLSVNTLLFLDDMTDARGPTYVVPGSHRGDECPSAEQLRSDLPHEVAAYAKAGDAIFINSAIWHTGNRNTTDGLRRGIYLYYGYWWLKRYDEHGEIPWQALVGASEQRLELLGIKMPAKDMHMYGQPILDV